MRYRELPNTQRFEAWFFSLSINIQCERFASLDVVSIVSLSLSSVFATAAYYLCISISDLALVSLSLFLLHSHCLTLIFSHSLSLSLVHSVNSFSRQIRYSQFLRTFIARRLLVSFETFAEKTRVSFTEKLFAFVYPD